MPRGISRGEIFTQIVPNSFIKDLKGRGLIDFVLCRLALEDL